MNRLEIESSINTIEVPNSLDLEMHNAFKISRYTHDYILNYLNCRSRDETISREEFGQHVLLKMNEFRDEVLPQLRRIRDNPIATADFNKNIFTFSGTEIFSKANDYTRLINRKLGEYLERITLFSPVCFSMEQNFEGLKLTGVDVIFLRNRELVYTQLKTKKDTLTGSQAPRSRMELTIYNNSMFVALLNLGSKWTFSPRNSSVERVSGESFWELIGLFYDIVESEVSRVILEIEQDLF